MTFVITSPCIADYSCVEACPENAISPTPDAPDFAKAEQLYINPTLCIDCEACVEACPVRAIYPAAMVPERWHSAIRLNAEYFKSANHV